MSAACDRDTLELSRALERTRESLRLDLSGLRVLTEAGSGPFALTAPLAACAGARHVVAVAGSYGTQPADEIAAHSEMLARNLGLADRVQVVTKRDGEWFGQADVVTNLGFVRPLDRETVGWLRPTAAIAFMREAWEWRSGEVDLEACDARGIAVFATDEHHPEVGVFDACGWLAIKLLLEAKADLAHGEVLVYSPDPFGPAIVRAIERLGARVRLETSAMACRARAADAAALVVADFNAERWIVADDGMLAPAALAERAPDLKVIAFAGGVDGDALARVGLSSMPVEGSRPGRMGRTLADLGRHTVLTLHGAGLKVGAAAARGRQLGLQGPQLEDYVLTHAPAQVLARATA